MKRKQTQKTLFQSFKKSVPEATAASGDTAAADHDDRITFTENQPDNPTATLLLPGFETMDQKIPYDDYQLPVVFLPSYESPPTWIPPQERMHHPDYNNELTKFLPRTIVLKKPPGAQLGFNIRGGKASQLGIFISKVVPDSDAHRAGLQEGDQVLSVNEVDFQDIEHSRAVDILKTTREILMRVRYFPY
uniref:PDZ domain-containing protein 11 n=1 Tax=Esox lucius TaxID=8010 RepID=A0A3P8XEM7_ESOLU